MRYINIIVLFLSIVSYYIPHTAHLTWCPPPDIGLQPFFAKVDTASKHERAKRGNMEIANACIESALLGMDKRITKGN